MKKNGFTLIEIIISIGVVGVILITVTTVLTNSLKAKNRLELNNFIETNGANVIKDVTNNVLLSQNIGMTCMYDATGIGNSIALINKFDSQVTRLVCIEGDRIASESAGGSISLTNTDVQVSGCNVFVSCDTMPSSDVARVTSVKFNFVLRAGATGNIENFTSRKFSVNVSPR